MYFLFYGLNFLCNMLHCLRSRYFPRGSLICKVLEKENFSGSSYKSLSLSSIALWVGATALTEADKSEIEEVIPFVCSRTHVLQTG